MHQMGEHVSLWVELDKVYDRLLVHYGVAIPLPCARLLLCTPATSLPEGGMHT
jgi:hypothetical protein